MVANAARSVNAKTASGGSGSPRIASAPVRELAMSDATLTIRASGSVGAAEQTVRKINITQVEVEDLRADYTTLKADLMFSSKQSEVARKVKPLGLKESLTPPYKIVVKEGEY